MRTRLHEGGREYVVAVSPNVGVFGPETGFTIPERTGKRGRPPTVPRPDRGPESVRALFPYLSPYWREYIDGAGAGISGLVVAYPPGAPTTARAEARDGCEPAILDRPRLRGHVDVRQLLLVVQ